MRPTHTRTKRPRGALLQLCIEIKPRMNRIGGRLWSRFVRNGGVAICNTTLLMFYFSLFSLSEKRTVHGRQFDWGGCLLKSTASAQRSPQSGWKSDGECMSIRRLYCEEDIPISYESRFKWPFRRMWNRDCLTKISYPGDNRLVVPDSSHWRHRSAPRCRLVTSWGWIRPQGFDCSSIIVARELGSDRREPGRSLSGMGVVYLRKLTLSTKGSGWGNL